MSSKESQHEEKHLWESQLVKLSDEVHARWLAKDYLGAWEAYRLYYSSCPGVTKQELLKLYEETESKIRNIYKTTTGYSLNDATRQVEYCLRTLLKDGMLKLNSDTTASLERHGYLRRDTGYSGIDPNKEADEI